MILISKILQEILFDLTMDFIDVSITMVRHLNILSKVKHIM